MSINDARKFVVKLRENHKFRNKTLETIGPEDLSSFLHKEGLFFVQYSLFVISTFGPRVLKQNSASLFFFRTPTILY